MKSRFARFILGVLLASSPVFAQAWTTLSGTTFNAAICPPDGYGGSVLENGNPYPYTSGGALGSNMGCSGATRAWNGGVARKKAGSEELYFLGQGGHGDYGGNEIYKLNLHANPPTFTRITNPSVLISSYYTNSTRSYPDGKPASRHLYDGLTYLGPTIDKFFMWNGSNYGGNGNHYLDGWIFDPAAADPNAAWTHVVPSTAAGCENIEGLGYSVGPNQVVTYNPNDGMVYIGANTHFWKFNYATSCYTHLSFNFVDEWKLKAVMDTSRNSLFYMGGGTAFRMSVTGTRTDLTSSINANCAVVKTSPGPGGFYDAANDLYVWYPSSTGNTLYLMNPTTLSCSTLTTTGGSTANVTAGMWGRFDFFPTLGKIAVLGDYGEAWRTLDYGTPPAPTTANTFTVKNEGATTANHPVQIGRAFVQGEIPNGSLPQAYIAGVGWVSTQVDVKARWADNSLKHAIISYLIPTFTGGQTYTTSFASGTTVGNTALTQAQMLAAGYDFDAVISLTNGGTTRTASARTMLTNGDYTVWASGPIATTILLGHHAQGFACPAGTASGAGAVSSKYDFGMNTRCAFRPLYIATFWATINKVNVRFIGEIANTEQLEDVAITSMLLTAGQASPATVYSRGTSLTMTAGSRWTKTTWIGGTPPVASFNHNLSYLASTKALPNYDTSKSISGSTITSVYSSWTGAAKDLYNKGMWDIPMGGGGGHSHVGPYPSWVVQFLYSGDYRMQEVSLGQADLLATMEWHFREGKTGKHLDRAGSVNGIGFPISISERPTINLYDFSQGNSGDRVTPVGTTTFSGWDSGTGFTYWGSIISHPPETFYPLYLVTGDYFYIEEGQFQASFMAGVLGAPATGDWRARGTTGAEGGIVDRGSQRFQTRGQAWALRSRAETAWAVPDANSFKSYLEQLLADTLAMWEGQRNITTGSYNGNSMWTHGRSQATTNTGSGTQWDSWEGPNGVITTPSPLHFWDNGSAAICDDRVNNLSVAKDCNSPWMEDYVLYALGRTVEIGYAGATALRNWLGQNPIGALTDTGYNPFLAGAYRSSIIQQSGSSYFATWAAAKTGFLSGVQTETDFYPGTIFSGCEPDGNANCQPLMAAVSMVADQTNGAAAWTFLAAEILPSVSGDLKWAILPRATGGTPTAPGMTMRVGARATIR